MSRVAKYDCTKDEDFCEKYGAKGYPSIVSYNNGVHIEEYEGKTNFADIIEYVNKLAEKYGGRDEL